MHYMGTKQGFYRPADITWRDFRNLRDYKWIAVYRDSEVIVPVSSRVYRGIVYIDHIELDREI